MVCIAFACLLAYEIGHFACLIFNPPLFFPLHPPFGKYSTDWVQRDGAVGGGRS